MYMYMSMYLLYMYIIYINKLVLYAVMHRKTAKLSLKSILWRFVFISSGLYERPKILV